MIAGFGRWDEDTESSERKAITFDLWSDEGATNVTIVDEGESSWSSGFYGEVLKRSCPVMWCSFVGSKSDRARAIQQAL